MFIALFNTSSLLTILMFCFTLRAAGTFFPYVVGMYWSSASKCDSLFPFSDFSDYMAKSSDKVNLRICI